MNKIQAGGNIAIEQTGSIDVAVSWLPENLAVEVCAFVLNSTEKVRSNNDLINQRQSSHTQGFIHLASTSGKQVFHVELAKIPQGVEKIVFTVATENTLTQFFDLNITVGNLVTFSPAFEAMQSLILGELYLRNQQWKFRAVGQGYAQGLAFLKDRYGVSLEQEFSPPPVLPNTSNEPSQQLLTANDAPSFSTTVNNEQTKHLPTTTQQQTNQPPFNLSANKKVARQIKLAKDFSFLWVLYSLVIFVVVEIFLAGIIGQMVVSGRFMPHTLNYLLEVVLIIMSFFIGGVIIGMISSKIRILEPAIAAFLCVLLTLSITFFSPYAFMTFSWTKVFIGGGTAFFLAWFGAYVGEKLSARLGNESSKEYFGDDL